MALPAMSTSRSLLRFRVLGVPVRVDMSFLLLAALYGIGGGNSLIDILVLVVIAGGSILVHEMGHALVARQAGAHPEIELHAMGGLTSWSGEHALSRRRMIAISVAGPAAGVALGLALLQARASAVFDVSGTSYYYLSFAIRINVLWGLLNLLPILPLDGGQVMRDLLPGDDARRLRLASGVSAVTGAALAVVALAYGQPFAALFAAYFAMTNFAALRGPRARPPAPENQQLQQAGALAAQGDLEGAMHLATTVADRAGDRRVALAATHLAAECLLLLDRPVDAKALLLDLPPGSVDPVLEGAVLAATGHAVIGIDKLHSAYAGAPDERSAYRLAEALARHGRKGEVASALRAAGGPTPDIVLAAAAGAEAGGAEDVAAELRSDAASS